jgi:hypothetical protein
MRAFLLLVLSSVVGVVVLGAGSARAEAPIQLALFSPVQIVPASESIHGVRLSLVYGDNHHVLGFDLGLVTHTGGDFAGYQLGVVGLIERDAIGWQNNWIFNFVGGEIRGAQTGVVNFNGEMLGAGLGGVNFSDRTEGFTLGLFNYAEDMTGLAIGIVNYATRLNGIQIGIVNIALDAAIPVLPLVNWSFS